MDKRKKKILHVVGAMNMGGTETMLMNIYKNIDRSKVQFDFISYSQEDAYYDKEIRKLGGKVIKLSKTQSINELCRAIKKNGPYDVIHAHTLFHCGVAMLAARKCGIKTRISHAHTTLDNNYSVVRKIYVNLMRNIINLLSTDLLYCSKEAARYLYGSKVLNNKKHRYYANVVDYTKFLHNKNREVAKFKEEQNIKSDLVIGHIGRFMEAKNHKFLLELLKSMVNKNIDVTLLLVGDGHMEKEIEYMAKEYNIYDKVRFLGIRKDIDVILQSMDVFIFPSIYEGLGLVMLEAQASGIPCVVSEAIQEEADLKVGLVNKLSLNDDIDKWIDVILSSKNKNEIKTNDIVRAFENSGYSVDKGIENLMNIYGV